MIIPAYFQGGGFSPFAVEAFFGLFAEGREGVDLNRHHNPMATNYHHLNFTLMKNVKDQISFLSAVIAFVIATLSSGFGGQGKSGTFTQAVSMLNDGPASKNSVILNGYDPGKSSATRSKQLLSVFEIADANMPNATGAENAPLRIRVMNATEKVLSFNYSLEISAGDVSKTEEGVLFLMPKEMQHFETLNAYAGVAADNKYILSLSHVETFESDTTTCEAMAHAE